MIDSPRGFWVWAGGLNQADVVGIDDRGGDLPDFYYPSRQSDRMIPSPGQPFVGPGRILSGRNKKHFAKNFIKFFRFPTPLNVLSVDILSINDKKTIFCHPGKFCCDCDFDMRYSRSFLYKFTA